MKYSDVWPRLLMGEKIKLKRWSQDHYIYLKDEVLYEHWMDGEIFCFDKFDRLVRLERLKKEEDWELVIDTKSADAWDKFREQFEDIFLNVDTISDITYNKIKDDAYKDEYYIKITTFNYDTYDFLKGVLYPTLKVDNIKVYIWVEYEEAE